MMAFEVPPVQTETARSQSPRHGRVSLPIPLEDENSGHVKSHSPALRLCLNMSMAVACSIGAVIAWDEHLWPVSLACWIVGGHFMHTFALSFHDAAHGTLHPNHTMNEFLGWSYGTLILVPLTVYRRAHVRHHTQLASVDDPELYPFVVPGTSRAFRLTCAIPEIALGYFYTPLLFARSVWVDQKMTPQVRHRILWEYALILSTVAASLTIIELIQKWPAYLIGILPPVLLAGSYQTLRKYTEHMGLSGRTILESTRSVLSEDRCNRTISSLLQHVDHHGTHHVCARIPYFELPHASEELFQDRADDLPVYGSYPAALWAMLKTLHDPKAGAQWHTSPSISAQRISAKAGLLSATQKAGQ